MPPGAALAARGGDPGIDPTAALSDAFHAASSNPSASQLSEASRCCDHQAAALCIEPVLSKGRVPVMVCSSF